jgi:hypothetical protein
MGVRRSVPALEACMVTARRTLRPRTIALLAGLGVALGGCFDIPTYSDFQLNISPFDNTYLNRGEATMEVWLMPGYTCPDEETARLYLVYSNTIETPAPLALVLHAEPFDYVRSDGTAFSSQVGEERLTVDWAALTAEKMMGIRDSGAGAFKPGALVASLVREGFYVVVPTNCWGDLWHGTGDNDYTEGFLRYGLYLADDSVKWAQSRVDTDPERVLLAGLAEGGRGIVDMVGYGWTDAAILIDSSPDYLPPLFGDPQNDEFIEGLEKIYGRGELTDEEFKTKLGEVSLYYQVSQGYVAPTIYLYSANDDFVSVELSRPAKNAIEDRYPPGMYFPEMETAESRHIITNNHRSKAEEVVEWLVDGWDDGFPPPTE